MYKILAFKNGQPIILYIENEKVYMYTAARGKIIPKGLLFNDVGRDFDVFSCNKQYVYYISTDNKMKLAVLNRDRFTAVSYTHLNVEYALVFFDTWLFVSHQKLLSL